MALLRKNAPTGGVAEPSYQDMQEINVAMYPLRFEPIYQYRLWGGRRLADLLTARCPVTALSAKPGC